MNNEEKIEATGKKEEGNALFKAGKYAKASKRYEKAAKFIEYDNTFSEEEKKKSKVQKVTCNLNNAACKPKLKDYKEVEKLCLKTSSFEFQLMFYNLGPQPAFIDSSVQLSVL
ncbi:70 kDa peptidyl-prolyl isomerase-like [Magnolia sinica]|uniref:70 kDa peptidyl-prolyl isomerase-like n=1 Tax=Magnolia sinica TaxID=86752 RepID=UPI00265AD3BF|nr:70 kDa peptidyl-prolyl isomerase-like [Magnolia sinica]